MILDIVCGVIVDEKGRMLISRRRKGAHLADFWEFPGGKVETGEEDEEALRREIGEELGAEIVVGELIHQKTHDYPDRRVRLRFYVCRSASAQPTFRALEVQTFRWVRPDELSHFRFPPANADLLQQLQAR